MFLKNANGDLTVDLRSNIAAEGRAKIVYEYLMKFTDDPLVKESLRFLMTREVANAQMFEAALETIQPNFPPGILQSDPRYSNKYFNMSDSESFRGPWNKGISPDLKEDWEYIDNPIDHIKETNGMLKEKPHGTDRTEDSAQKTNKTISKERNKLIKESTSPDKDGTMSWKMKH